MTTPPQAENGPLSATPRHLSIIGAGLAGAMLGILLRQRGWQVDIYEKRGDPRIAGYAGGRSINLALAERGRHALRQADADDAVMRHAIMMLPTRSIGSPPTQENGGHEEEQIQRGTDHRVPQAG